MKDKRGVNVVVDPVEGAVVPFSICEKVKRFIPKTKKRKKK